MRKRLVMVLAGLMVLAGCNSEKSSSQPTNSESTIAESAAVTVAEPYSDLRGGLEVDFLTLLQNEYLPEDMYTYNFNERTVFEGNEKLQKKILENGKNPGLGIRALHERGFTGKGVSVAIIDQDILLESPEFADRIADYYECGYDFEGGSSMHGSAVTSILVGKTTGVAPDATVYYAAAPSWTGDSAYFADGLDWIINQNKALPDSKKSV